MVTIKSNRGQIQVKVKNRWKKAVGPLSQQILKDCNKYCRQDQGSLIASSLIHSRPQDGALVWSTPYAQKVYYTGTPSKDMNPNASLMWCEKARGAHGADWAKSANTLYKGAGG